MVYSTQLQPYNVSHKLRDYLRITGRTARRLHIGPLDNGSGQVRI